MITRNMKLLGVVESKGGICYKIVLSSNNTIKVVRLDNSLLPTTVNANSSVLSEVVSYFKKLPTTLSVTMYNS